MSWATKELGEVAELDRSSISASEIEPGTNYLGLEHIESGGKILEFPTVTNGELASSKFRFTKDHVLYGKLRPYLAKIALPTFSGICSTDIIPVLPGPNLDRRYLCYFLRQGSMVDYANSRAAGANLPRLSPKELARLEIPLPPLAEQKRIAGVLDAADALRARRREALAQLDTLLQATFLDLFGDPVTNPMGFPVKTLSEFYINDRDGTKCGPFGSALKKEEFVESGVPVWNMDNIDRSGRMVLPFRSWISSSKYENLKSYAVLDGDVLISRAGTVGKMCVARSGSDRSIISTNLIRVRFGAGLLPVHFVSMMTYCKGRIGRLKVGPDGAFTHMSTGVLDELKFPYPPIETQRCFERVVESIERQKEVHHSHLSELDTLFTSLQHRAFRGEL